MTLCDTGPLIALIDASDAHHTRCAAILPGRRGPLLTTWPCLTEATHFLGRGGGWRLQRALWALVDAGALVLHSPNAAEASRVRALMEQYQDLPMDLADASVVAAAESLHLAEVFTLDRHFHIDRLRGSSALSIIP